MRRGRTAVSLLALALYLGVMAASAVCPVDHVGPPQGHHHHAATALHSSLCAWACQASSAGAPVAGSFPLPFILVQLPLAALAATIPAGHPSGAPLTRGPPFRPAV